MREFRRNVPGAWRQRLWAMGCVKLVGRQCVARASPRAAAMPRALVWLLVLLAALTGSSRAAPSAPCRVTRMEPAGGPPSGGTEVTMIGSNFTGSFSHVSSGHTFCRWGPTGALVKPSFVSGTRIICASPPSSSVNPTMVTVHVTNDGGYTFSTDVLTFSYETQEHVASLEPSAGPETGNTLVRVHGQGFRRLNLLSCRFGSVIVSAAWVSDTMVECMSQPTPAGTTVDVRVANNGHDFSTSSAVYMYTALVTISSHLPTGVLSEGGSAVAISGTGFLDLSTLICKFGIKVVPATFQTSTLVTCTAPFLDVGSFTLQVSNNGRDFATGKPR